MNDVRAYWDEMARLGPNRSVIDPKDSRGYKNRYIIDLRDRVILDALSDIPKPARVLDFGCGSGNLSRTLADNGYQPIGLDISLNLLMEARRHRLGRIAFIQYDGRHLPFCSNSFDACVTHWVFIYLTDTEPFCRILEEIFRVLKPGSNLIAVEQTRRKSTFKPGEMKVQRSAEEMLQLFEKAGFRVKEKRIIRRGHFPLTYLIRYGLVPSSFFPQIGKMEAFLGELFREPRFDYADRIFVAEKPG